MIDASKRAVKGFLRLLLSLFIGLAIMVALSLYGERDYLQNCKNLDIKCEPGNVQKATETISSWLQDSYQEIKKKFSD